MKKLLVVFCLLCLCLGAMAQTNKFKEIKNFPFGCWQYMDLKTQSPNNVKDWEDLGLNLVISPQYFANTTPKEQFIEILDECQKKNIQVIVQDRRCFYSELSKGENVYRKQVKAAINDFGSHPAVLGFFVCDEPNKSNLKEALKATKINKELAPDLSPFINHYPWGRDDKMIEKLGFNTCEEYIDYVCKHGAIDLISMDCYAQMDPDRKDNFDYYFRCLNRYSTEARRHNLPFYATNLSIAHYNYQNLTDDEFRWQINTSFAHGANGIMWYVLRPTNKNANYRNSPINLLGQRTPVFDYLSFENKMFSLCYNKIAPNLVLENVYHCYNSYGDTPLFEGNDIIKSLESKTKTPIIVSFFNDNYVAIVNNSIDKNNNIVLTFGYKVKSCDVIVENSNMKEIYPKKYGCFAQKKDKVIDFWLAPGGMELFKINTI